MSVEDLNAGWEHDRSKSVIANLDDPMINVAFHPEKGSPVVTAWNSAAETFFGINSSEAVGQSLSSLLFPDDANAAARHESQIMSVLKGPLGRRAMMDGLDRDRIIPWRDKFLDIRLTTTEVDNRREVNARIIDRTSQINLEQSLRDAQDALSTELANERDVIDQLRLDRGKTQRHVVFVLAVMLVYFGTIAGLCEAFIPDAPLTVLVSVSGAVSSLLSMAVGFYFKGYDGRNKHQGSNVNSNENTR